MPRLLIATITKCSLCPFCLTNMECQLRDGQTIEDEDLPIPDWCPLADKKDIDDYTMLSELKEYVLEDIVFEFLIY